MARRITAELGRHYDLAEKAENGQLTVDNLDNAWRIKFPFAVSQWADRCSVPLDLQQCITFPTVDTRSVVESVFGFYYPRRKASLETRLNRCRTKQERLNVLSEEKFFNDLVIIARNKRKRELSFRLLCHTELRARQGAFMVFNTLTYRDGEDPEVIFRDGFSDYVKRFDKAVYEAMGYTKREAHRRRKDPEGWYHEYFAVVERGSRGGRLHVHVLHFCRRLPAGCFDPNSGRVAGRRRVISALRSLWEYGQSDPVSVRFSYDDAYGKLNWAWPAGAGKSSPGRLAGYLTKYICEAYEPSFNSGSMKTWRTRLSPQLGMHPLHKVMERLEEKTLLAVAQLPRTTPAMRLAGRRTPSDLLRKCATRAYLRRLGTFSRLSFLASLKRETGIAERWRSLIDATLCAVRRKPSPGLGLTERYTELEPRDISELESALREVDRELFPPAFPVVGGFDARLSPGGFQPVAG